MFHARGKGVGGGGGVLDQYLSIGEPLRVWNPDPVSGKRFLKYIPCLGQHPPFYYGLFRTKDVRENSRYNHCFCIPGVQRKFMWQIKSIVQAIHVSCSRLSVSWEDAKVKGTRKVGGAGDSDSHEFIYPVWDREDKNHTLSSGTSPYRPYKGIPPPPAGGGGSWDLCFLQDYIFSKRIGKRKPLSY